MHPARTHTRTDGRTDGRTQTHARTHVDVRTQARTHTNEYQWSFCLDHLHQQHHSLAPTNLQRLTHDPNLNMHGVGNACTDMYMHMCMYMSCTCTRACTCTCTCPCPCVSRPWKQIPTRTIRRLQEAPQALVEAPEHLRRHQSLFAVALLEFVHQGHRYSRAWWSQRVVEREQRWRS